jgi:pimeloyl-ACP methyl ester carboxylesterase
LIGHAYGQALCRCIVAGHQDFAKSLTLLACGGSSPSQDLFSSVRACFDEALAVEHPDMHLQHVKRVFFAPASDASPWAGGWLAEVARLQMEALLHTPPTAWMSASIVPTQVIQALQDELAPPQGGRDYVANHPEVSLIELDGAGHAMLPEQPLAIAEATIEFLRRAEAQS